MMNPKTDHTFHFIGTLSVLLAVYLLSTGGCAKVSNTDRLRDAAKAEVNDPTPMMSPAQRDRWFRGNYSKGMERVQQGDYGLALGAFEKALSLKPDSIEAMFNVGACHEALGDPVKAIGVYRRIVKVTPNDPDCYANLGTCYIKMYYREKSPVWRKMARQAWQHSLRLNADQPEIKAFLAKGHSPDEGIEQE